MGPNPRWLVSLWEEISRHTHKGQSSEDTERERTIYSPKRVASGETTLPAPWSHSVSLQNCEKINICWLSPWSVVICYGSPNKLIKVIKKKKRKITNPDTKSWQRYYKKRLLHTHEYHLKTQIQKHLTYKQTKSTIYRRITTKWGLCPGIQDWFNTQ